MVLSRIRFWIIPRIEDPILDSGFRFWIIERSGEGERRRALHVGNLGSGAFEERSTRYSGIFRRGQGGERRGGDP